MDAFTKRSRTEAALRYFVVKILFYLSVFTVLYQFLYRIDSVSILFGNFILPCWLVLSAESSNKKKTVSQDRFILRKSFSNSEIQMKHMLKYDKRPKR